MISPAKGALIRAADMSVSGARGFVFQYNPTHLRRTLEPSRDGAPHEEINLEILLDAGLENSSTGVVTQLAAMEALLRPSAGDQPGAFARLFGARARPGLPLAFFRWGQNRTVPVRMLQLAVTEEIFDPALTVLRATVRIRMDVATEAEVSNNSDVRNYLRYYHATNEKLAAQGLSDVPPLT